MRTIFLLTLALLTFSAHAVDTPTGSVRGVIFNEVGRPKLHALVGQLGTDHCAYTDVSGHFQIDRIPSGRRYFQVLHPDMNPASFDVVIVAGDTVTIRPIYLRPFGMSDSVAAAESIGVDVPWGTSALTCEIRPTQKIFHVGDQPDFRVSITNRGKQPLDLVYASEGGLPKATIQLEILALAAGHILPSHPGFLAGRDVIPVDYTTGISADDFVHLEPGESIDPYAKNRRPPWRTKTFELPGTYRATFNYSTKQPDVRHWLGLGERSIDPKMSKLFRTMPMVELSASTEFEVVE